jgi:hypothetical protein
LQTTLRSLARVSGLRLSHFRSSITIPKFKPDLKNARPLSEALISVSDKTGWKSWVTIFRGTQSSFIRPGRFWYDGFRRVAGSMMTSCQSQLLFEHFAMSKCKHGRTTQTRLGSFVQFSKADSLQKSAGSVI